MEIRGKKWRNLIQVLNEISRLKEISAIEILNCPEILDILGTKIKIIEPNTNLAEINISKKPSGVYFLKISLENGNIITKKIVCK